MSELRETGRLSPGQTAFLWLLPVVTAVLALGIGRLWISPAEIVQSYTEVTGRAPVMPENVLGLWQCKLRAHLPDWRQIRWQCARSQG